jgi:carbonic anhydrase
VEQRLPLRILEAAQTIANVGNNAQGGETRRLFCGCLAAGLPFASTAVHCARVAGNIVNTDIIGSLEYSTKVSGAKAIVVLGA